MHQLTLKQQSNYLDQNESMAADVNVHTSFNEFCSSSSREHPSNRTLGTTLEVCVRVKTLRHSNVLSMSMNLLFDTL